MALTGVDDMHFEIMLNMNADDLASLCTTNKDVKKLCHTRSFWRQKFKQEGLSLPTMLLDEPGLNYINVFTTLQIMDRMIHDMMFHDETIVNYTNPYYNLDDFLYLFNIVGVNLSTAENDHHVMVPMVIDEDMILKDMSYEYVKFQFRVRLTLPTLAQVRERRLIFKRDVIDMPRLVLLDEQTVHYTLRLNLQ